MKKIITALLFAAMATAAQASPVTIDFEEFTVPTSVGPTSVLQTQGYDIEATSFAVGSGLEGGTVINGQTGSQTYKTSIFGFSQDSFSPSASMTVSRTDGSAFALYSIDWFTEELPDLPVVSFQGITSGGGTVDLSTPLGTGGWLDLQSFSIGSGGGDGFTTVGTVAVEIDNLVVAAVPVPAAVWLFGSALAGLGWMRRRVS